MSMEPGGRPPSPPAPGMPGGAREAASRGEAAVRREAAVRPEAGARPGAAVYREAAQHGEAPVHGEVQRGEDPAVLRRRISVERAQLALTVEELAARFDVKARMRQRRAELRERLRERLRSAGHAARRFGIQVARSTMAALREIVRAIRQLADDLRSGGVRGPRALPPGPVATRRSAAYGPAASPGGAAAREPAVAGSAAAHGSPMAEPPAAHGSAAAPSITPASPGRHRYEDEQRR